MVYDEVLAQRVRKLLPKADEKRLFGGIGLMERGRMVAGVSRDDLIVRVPPEETDRWLREPGAHEMMEGRRMRGCIRVSSRSLGSDAILSAWVERSRRAAQELPPKRPRRSGR